MENNKEKKVNSGKLDYAFWAPALGIFSRFTAWIVAPVFVGALLGIYFDKKFNTEPWIFILGIAIAFIISMIGLAKNALNEYKKQEERNKKNK